MRKWLRSRTVWILIGSIFAVAGWLTVTLPPALAVLTIAPVSLSEKSLRAKLPETASGRPTAVVLMSQAGTEITDFLGPYAVLAASEAFNVYAVSADTAPAAMNGGLGILPHVTLKELDWAFPKGPDVIVVPNMLDYATSPFVRWIRDHARPGAIVVSICEGARILARTGLIEGKQGTTHWAALNELERTFPKTTWQRKVRFTEDGDILMSAGVTAGLDATLRVVERVAGTEAAKRARDRLHLTQTVAGNPTRSFDLEVGGFTTAILNGLFAWPRLRIAVPLYDGIDELGLAAILDTYPRTFAAVTTTVTSARAPARSRYGLTLVPVADVSTLTPSAEIYVPLQQQESKDIPNLAVLLSAFHGPKLFLGDDDAQPSFPFDAALSDITERFDTSTARLAADQLEYPAVLNLEANGGRFYLLLGAAVGIVIAGGMAGWLIHWILFRRAKPCLARTSADPKAPRVSKRRQR